MGKRKRKRGRVTGLEGINHHFTSALPLFCFNGSLLCTFRTGVHYSKSSRVVNFFLTHSLPRVFLLLGTRHVNRPAVAFAFTGPVGLCLSVRYVAKHLAEPEQNRLVYIY